MTAGALGQPRTFEWWMLSMFAIGISYSALATGSSRTRSPFQPRTVLATLTRSSAGFRQQQLRKA
jgi:hypothetical protein